MRLRRNILPVGADDGPSVESQGHLDQEQGQETPEEEERVELAEDRVTLVVTANINNNKNILSRSYLCMAAAVYYCKNPESLYVLIRVSII